ncbi:TetR/AcrR family transcriptional regulator [Arthrobacter sp. MI7-26]|uniref:TetR/AcrR family transcriptional regulator n=1 Tax=Arthrobacter sp. MI7-26 TaxID=2993653 RepID=UPI002248B9A4|nr:TetR/AcrR family transcriptional regulator [Arthrobacter sp. MI7-26]MCX2746839.1 TetR/AcrR family transcriptional regulator [Arthrobacter sp. MI7-26]
MAAPVIAQRKTSVRSAPSKKGQQTRARILDAGRQVLSDRGYFGATVGEIAERSGLALGSIYRYFDNKDDLFLELLEELVETLFTSVDGSWVKGREQESLRESSRRYLSTYFSNRHLIAGLLEMSAAVPECAERWWLLRQKTFTRKAEYVRRASGKDPLKPEYAAVALATMVEQLAFHWFVESERHGGQAPDLEEAADTVSIIWYRALYASGQES